MTFFLSGAAGLLVLLAGFVVASILRNRRRVARWTAAFPPRGRFIEVQGQRLHVVQDGPEDGPDVVLLHGASINLRDLEITLVPGLVRAGFRVTLFDRPGLGHSLPCDLHISLRRQAELLDEAAGKLGLERFILTGQSFGGAVATSWAVHRPERVAGLVSISAPVLPWPPEIPRHFRLLARPLAGPLLARLIAAWLPLARLERELAEQFHPAPLPADYLARSGALLAQRPETLHNDACQRLRLLRDQRAMVEALPRLRLPVELVHGTQDTKVRPDRHAEPLREEIPGARLKRLAGLGHMPHHAEPEACVEAIRRAARRGGLLPAVQAPPRAQLLEAHP
ncbi:Pimeloyl-ACP methyl ester carboxylesterase [Pseudooceanicola antarcticus]|uniref:Alpha/beta hydrolase n=1 Tax=Pseudooceanicola antarcticus TaxID=1247613 RepID=A0A285IZF0_9RHOB|nr:alpha/beta hydrolase [Pseudooceanicola antarcticus]PJE25946.1 alpha/beta hydrolase [Pseudooceanicola antarcticus]SNY52291.1 Pimeloyl-ACP methyl ester carboxylesterase [Pseudooceanicola antarcticus]